MDEIRHIKDTVEEGIDNIRERVEQARGRIEDFTEKAKTQSEESWKDAVKFVQKHPAQSLGIAAVVGAVLGALLLGRRRD